VINAEVVDLAKNLAAVTGARVRPGISIAELHALESVLDMPLPQDLQDWLTSLVAPHLIDGRLLTYAPLEPRIDIVAIVRSTPIYRTNGWIPLAIDSAGNPYVALVHATDMDGTPVACIDREVDHAQLDYLVASTVWKFVAFLLERETQIAGLKAIADEDEWDAAFDRVDYWPFDKQHVLAQDPKLVMLKYAPLPWDSP
jgi:cell wall assembly regulator SMI1